jgi:hypothetical protein
MERKSAVIARWGLDLGEPALRRLREAGIYAQSDVNLEHQDPRTPRDLST